MSLSRRDFLMTAAVVPVATLVPTVLPLSAEEKSEETSSPSEKAPLVGEIIQHGKCVKRKSYRIARCKSRVVEPRAYLLRRVEAQTKVWTYKGWAVIGAPEFHLLYTYSGVLPDNFWAADESPSINFHREAERVQQQLIRDCPLRVRARLTSYREGRDWIGVMGG